MKKIYITQGGPRDINWLGKNYTETHDIDSADFVLFTGGEDVNPALYNQNRNPKTHFSVERDEYELNIYNQAIKKNIPMIGICRGSQFLCVMNGGKLWQHVRHPGIHEIKTKYGTKLDCNSYHHQMLDLGTFDKESYDLIAWAQNISYLKENDSFAVETDDSYREPEMVYFPKTKCFVMQYHPEYEPDSEFAKFAKEEFEKVFPND